MDTNPILIELLSQLKMASLASEFSKENLITAMETILLWLNRLENNTDKNCQQIDAFIAREIIPEKRFEEIPENLRSILFDMGATLHDTYTSPEVAENFESTPAQLLARVQNLQR